ncbi:MAG: LysR family transcriptional regulator [Planctomycetes bacterium]|nr:LysR family transcriptional regulator [Planctomycetota bacterium]
MDLNELVVFVEVVRAGSFTAGARALGMPKSTASRKVSELEARLGAQLLVRTTRRLRLTDVGAAYFERAARVVAEARAADRLVADLHADPCGRLRVTAPLTFAFLGPIVAEFLAQHPAVQVDLVCTDRVVDLVAEGFDVAVRAGRMADSSLVARRLGTVQRFLVAAPGYLRRRPAPRAPADLAGHDTILFGGGDEGTTWTLRAGRQQVEVALRPRLVVNDYDMLREAATAGLGIALLPDYVCEERQRLERLLPAWTAPEVPIHAVYPAGRQTSRTVAAFLDQLKRRFAPRR